jgi:hypothetical protein
MKKRIISMVTVALVVSAMVAVSALPVIASPPSKLVNCDTPTGEHVSSNSTGEAMGFRSQGADRANCVSEGHVVTQVVTPNPGPSNPYPPGKGRPPLP